MTKMNCHFKDMGNHIWHFLALALFLKVKQISASSWTAEVPSSVPGLLGSCVVVPCSFNYPEPKKKLSDLTGIWAIEFSKMIYHPDESVVIQDYKGRAQLVGNLVDNNCSLKIDPLHESDAGPFHFRIEIKDVDKYSYVKKPVSIEIKNLADPPSLIISDELRAGKQFTASCSVTHSCPSDPPHLTWNHPLIPTIQSQQLTNGQWKMTSSLTFTPTKSDHNDPLNCTAAYRGGEKVESSRRLIVKYAPVDVKVECEASVEEGDSVELRCSSDGNPAVHSYQWHSSSGALQFEGQVYRLVNVSRHTEALYCTAINTEGQGRSSLEQLNVLYPPKFKVGSGCHSNISTVTCLCMVDSAPPSLVQWSVPDRVLPITKVERHSSVVIATLHETVGFADHALCHASNTKGNATMSFTLNKSDNAWMIHAVVAASMFAMAVTFVSVWRLIKKCRGSQDNQPRTVMQDTDGAKANASHSSTANRQEGKESNHVVYTKTYADQPVYSNMEEEERFQKWEDVLDEDSIYANV